MNLDNYKKVYSREQIAGAARRIGSEITAWAAESTSRSGRQLLAVPVLRGGLFFFADLVREIAASVEVAPISLQAYKAGVNAEQSEQMQIDFEDGIFGGRNVLLVDDICDSGRSLKVLTQRIRDEGAAEVRTAVLIHREQKTEVFTPEWIGMRYSGPEWFVGYGMDDRGCFRNLPDVYIIMKPEQ